MLGHKSPQGELFRPDNLLREHVGFESFHSALGEMRGRYFRDEDFEEMYGERGRPCVPPSQLCIAIILQAHAGISDQEAIARTAYDLRWKVALGLELDEQLCAKSTLQLFRSRLVLHEKYRTLFDTSVQECRRHGFVNRRKLEVAIDTTPILGRGAVKDTFNLVSDQIRQVIKDVVTLKRYDLDTLVDKEGLGRHFSSSFKSEFDVDWSDDDGKRAVIGQLVADARVALNVAKLALRGYRRDAEETQELREAQALLAALLLQDIEEEPEDGQGPKIRKGTARDRIVSVTDPEMRHGRKSSSKRFDGHKASIAVDAESGVVLATDVIAGNSHDAEGAGSLVEQAGESAEQDVDRVLGDTAYGTSEARKDIAQATDDAELIAKVPPATTRKELEFTVEDFEIDTAGGKARCPAGKNSIGYSRPKGTRNHRIVFSESDCRGCSLRSKCTTSKRKARAITVCEGYEELKQLRARQRTKRFKKAYRRRVKVEHRIARLVQLGIRQARYFGRAKVAFQVSMAAAVANLVLAWI